MQGGHPPGLEGLRGSDAVPAGLVDAGVVQKPVDGRCDLSLEHELVEAGEAEVGADRLRALRCGPHGSLSVGSAMMIQWGAIVGLVEGVAV